MVAERAVVSFATDRFLARQQRLRESLVRVGFGGRVLAWGPAYPEGWPTQWDVPFAFKPLSFAAARRCGAEVVLWMDASCAAIRPLEPLLDEVERRGYALFGNGGYVVGAWSADVALEHFGVSRDAAMQIPEVNAAAVGLDLRHPLGAEFLARWSAAASEGTPFRGSADPIRAKDDYGDIKWNRNGKVSPDPRVGGHRHDQTVAGLVAHELGMELTDGVLVPFPEGRAAVGPRTAILVVRDGAVGLDSLPQEA
jgi:hypothetical protein